MRSCVRFAPMIGSRPGELPAEDARALAAHLETCPGCRALAGSFAATDGLVAEALLARASARDFAPFVDEVMAGFAAGRRSSGRARTTDVRSLVHGLRGRWKLTLAAAATAVVLAAAGSFMYRGGRVEEPEQRLASLEVELSGEGSIVLQTSDGPVVLLAPDDDTGS